MPARLVALLRGSLGLAFLLGAAGADAQPAPFEPELHQPLASGDSWTYSTTLGGTATDTVLAGVEVVGGVETQVVESVGPDGTVRQNLTNDELGLRLHRAIIPGELTLVFVPPAVQAPALLPAGVTHTVFGGGTVSAVGFGSGAMSYSLTTVLEGEEAVSVPAGVFDATRMRLQMNVSGVAGTTPFAASSVETNWFAPGVGTIKAIIAVSGEPTETQELLFFEVPEPRGATLAAAALACLAVMGQRRTRS